MTTSHAPGVAFDGGVNVQVIIVEDCTFTLVAVMFGLSAFIRATVAPDWKFVPVRAVMETAVPAVPSSGTIFLKVGLPVGEGVVVVVVVVVVLPVADVVIVAKVVATVVGRRITIEEGGLLVIFSVLVFSKAVLVTVSVLEFVR
jgi:hypothetical protein